MCCLVHVLGRFVYLETSREGRPQAAGRLFDKKGASARAYARSRSVLQLCRKGRRNRRGPFPGLCGHLPASVTGREAPRVRRRGCISNAPH